MSGTALCAFVALASAAPGATRDMAVMQQRLFDAFLAAEPSSDHQIDKLVASVRPDGSWPDVDYTDLNPARWETFEHLYRVVAMAQHCRRPGSKWTGHEGLEKATLAAFGYWVLKDIGHAKSWWWTQVAVPRVVGMTLILMGDAVPPDIRRAALPIAGRQVSQRTGQNLLWGCGNQITYGIAAGKPDTVAKAYRLVGGLFDHNKQGTDGIQFDNSFHQHDRVVYTGGYGRSFFTDGAFLAYLAHGTRFAMPAERLAALSAYMLDGAQWVIRGRTFDYGVVGRSITRRQPSCEKGGKQKHGSIALFSLADAADMMARTPGPRQAEFRRFADRLRNGATAANALEGNRHFWTSDHMVHRRAGYYTSVRMFSSRMHNTDWPCNHEGKKSHFLADGCTFFLCSGREYADIFPVWDWRKIPGTTVRQSPARLTTKGVRTRGTKAFVGGVSDGRYGVAAMDFRRGQLSARKSWFCFDRQFVCLGTAIASRAKGPVLTTVNQCHLRGDVTVGDAAARRPATRGEQSLTAPCWVHHDGVGYVFPGGGAPLHLRTDAQTGSWYDINSGKFKTREMETHDVYALWLDHGERVADGSYCYTVLPASTVRDVARYAERPDVQVLSNTAQLQAVWHKPLGIVGAAFYEPGTVRTPSGRSIGVDRPCLVLWRETARQVCISVANPENQPLEVTLAVDTRLDGEGGTWDARSGQSLIRVGLPDGPFAGQSVTRALARTTP